MEFNDNMVNILPIVDQSHPNNREIRKNGSNEMKSDFLFKKTSPHRKIENMNPLRHSRNLSIN